jgi:hypothetical protein
MIQARTVDTGSGAAAAEPAGIVTLGSFRRVCRRTGSDALSHLKFAWWRRSSPDPRGPAEPGPRWDTLPRATPAEERNWAQKAIRACALHHVPERLGIAIVAAGGVLLLAIKP